MTGNVISRHIKKALCVSCAYLVWENNEEEIILVSVCVD